jgi:secreted trypsin-like serine protease
MPLRAFPTLLAASATSLALACADAPTASIAPPDRPSLITGNYQEDFVHPWVGLVAFYDANGEFLWRCSGSLLSPTVFLTAGHCIGDNEEQAVSARIWFAQDAGAHYDPATQFDPVTGYPDTCLPQPDPCVTSHELYTFGYPAGFPNTKDVGLVILDTPVQLSSYGELAPVGTLDALATQRGRQDVSFVSSGYGLSYTRPTTTLSFRSRLMATADLVNLRSALTDGFNLQTGANPGGGRGGTCFGDSGGPILYQGLIVGVTSFGLNGNCVGVDFAYRVDVAAVQEWIEGITGEPL